MHPEIVSALQHVFEQCDEKCEGHIYRSDLLQLCQSSPTVASFFGLPELTRGAMEALFAAIDGNDDRKLTWEEFCKLFICLETASCARGLIATTDLASSHGTGKNVPGGGTLATGACVLSPMSEASCHSPDNISVEGALLRMAAALDASRDGSPSRRLGVRQTPEACQEWRRRVEHSVVGWRGGVRLSAEVNQSIGAAALAVDSARVMAPSVERLPPPTPLNTPPGAQLKDGGFSSSSRSVSTRSPSSFDELKSINVKHDGIREKAEEAFRNKDYIAAVTLYTFALAEDPEDHATLHSDRAVCLAMLGKYPEALQDARSCVVLQPDSAVGYARLGLAQYCLGAYDDAVESYKQGLELSPDDTTLQDGLQQALVAAELLGSASVDEMVNGIVLRRV
jgi:hypothetical protein